LAASGTPLHDDEFIAYLLVSLNEEYNPVFTAIVARVDPISLTDLYAQLLSFELHTTLQATTTPSGSSSAMTATRGPGFLVVAAMVALIMAGVMIVVSSLVVAATIGLGEALATHHGPNVKSA
jgi:hypothetical protein